MSRTVPNCNRSFLIESLLENKRVDNRTFYQFRDLQVNFGETFGSCYVQLGNTVIYSSTEATLAEPRIARPSEGRFKVIINIGAGGKEKWLRNIERSQPKKAILTTRILEKIINRINVLDLESLCLITGKSVWCISTKLVLLNYDGNLIEAASIAAIASLMHFKRPDATVTPDGEIIVHSFKERSPIPLTLFHYPICVTFQFMDHTHLKKILSDNQEILLEQHKSRVRKATQLIICDPTEEEEDFLHNVLIICANVYKEIVAIQSIGPLSLSSFSKQLLRICTNKAFERVKFVTDYLKSCLEKHNNFGPDMFHRYGFYEAIKNGDLCIVQNYDKNPIFCQSYNNDSSIVPEENDSGLTSSSKWTVDIEDDLNDENQETEEQIEQSEVQHSSNIPTTEIKSAPKRYSEIVGKPKKKTSQIAQIEKSQIIVEKSNTKSKSRKVEKKNQWTIVDKKKTEIKSTIKKSNEKKTKDKKMYNEDDDEEEEVVQLKWEYTKND